MKNLEKYTREYRNAVLRKWRHEHPDKVKESALRNHESMEKRHPGYYEEKSQEWKLVNAMQRHAVDTARNNSFRLLLTRPSCSKCGSKERIERHHPDYSKPLEFVLLCRACHRKIHWKPYEEILQKIGYKPIPFYQAKCIGGSKE